jgi:hypothetical protein
MAKFAADDEKFYSDDGLYGHFGTLNIIFSCVNSWAAGRGHQERKTDRACSALLWIVLRQAVAVTERSENNQTTWSMFVFLSLRLGGRESRAYAPPPGRDRLAGSRQCAWVRRLVHFEVSAGPA